MGTIILANVAAWVHGRLTVLQRDLRDGDVEPVMKRCVEEAQKLTAEDMVNARAVVHRSSRQMAEFQREYDVILTPTVATLPGRHGLMSLSGSYEAHQSGHFNFIPFTPLANWTGQPAMSVPSYWTAENLPVGVHFFGRFGDEATLFRLARQLEIARPWADRRPSI